MDQVLVAEFPIDNEIATVRAQIEALRHRRSLLSHTLLSARKFKTQVSRQNVTASFSQASIQSAREQIADQENITIANLHRTCAGITAFRVQDPDPNAVDAGNLLGIRFDVFSTDSRAFDTPYYVLLNQPEAGSGHFKIHKHTVPVFIPLQALAKKHLPYSNDENSTLSKEGHTQDLPKFVRALRKELIAHHKRITSYERLKRSLDKRQGVKEVKMLDITAKELEIVFTDKIVARLRLATDGKIQKAAVGPSADTGTEEHSMSTYRDIKKAIEGGDGSIETLSTRIRLRSKR